MTECRVLNVWHASCIFATDMFGKKNSFIHFNGDEDNVDDSPEFLPLFSKQEDKVIL